MIRVGLIGCGRIGRVHADSVTVHRRAELARVVDPVEAAAREVGERFGAPSGTDVDAVIGDPTIDAVVVASPTPTHVDLLTAAVRAGKAVLCEKPIDLDVARVDACRAAIGPLADRVMLGFNRRFDPSFADIRARVAAGEIGTLEQLDDHQPRTSPRRGTSTPRSSCSAARPAPCARSPTPGAPRRHGFLPRVRRRPRRARPGRCGEREPAHGRGGEGRPLTGVTGGG